MFRARVVLRTLTSASVVGDGRRRACITYAAEQSAEHMAEDAEIASFPIPVREENITIIGINDVFRVGPVGAVGSSPWESREAGGSGTHRPSLISTSARTVDVDALQIPQNEA